MKKYLTLAAAAMSIAALGSCGSDSAPASSATTSTAATTAATPAASTAATTAATTAASTADTASTSSGTDVATKVPSHIVSMSPSATEMMFAIGAGSQVIAVDTYSNFPADALKVPHELSAYEPNVEAIAAMKPDLVLLSDDKIKAQLEGLGIKVWVGAAAGTFDDVYTQIEQLGATTGHVADAAALVGNMQTDLDKIAKSVPKRAAPLTYFHELDNTLYSATSDTFIGQVYGLFGMRNIADTAEAGNQYPQLSAEFVITANPDLIYLADAGLGESPQTVAARPGWDKITAVAKGDVIAVDADVASRWGPRVVDYAQAVADSLAKVPVGA